MLGELETHISGVGVRENLGVFVFFCVCLCFFVFFVFLLCFGVLFMFFCDFSFFCFFYVFFVFFCVFLRFWGVWGVPPWVAWFFIVWSLRSEGRISERSSPLSFRKAPYRGAMALTGAPAGGALLGWTPHTSRHPQTKIRKPGNGGRRGGGQIKNRKITKHHNKKQKIKTKTIPNRACGFLVDANKRP